MTSLDITPTSLSLWVLAAIVVIGLVWAVATEPARRREFNALAEVTVNGDAATVCTIIDKVQRKSWRVVVIGNGAVILPGSEQTLPVEKP